MPKWYQAFSSLSDHQTFKKWSYSTLHQRDNGAYFTGVAQSIHRRWYCTFTWMRHWHFEISCWTGGVWRMIDLIKLELLYRKYRNGLRNDGKSYKFTRLKTFIAYRPPSWFHTHGIGRMLVTRCWWRWTPSSGADRRTTRRCLCSSVCPCAGDLEVGD